MADDHSPGPWHDGELTLQRSVGAEARMAEAGRRFIRDHMPDQHRAFFAQLPFAALGAVDEEGDPWATLVAGRPGFMTSPDPRTLDIRARPDADDPATAALQVGAPVGLLGIEPPTRRRNRMNGRVVRIDDGGFSVAVEHSFGNCPQYILTRAPAFSREPDSRAAIPPERLDALDAEARAMIAGADLFFVASWADAPAGRQVDVSHRGGKPGFVRVGVDGTLTIPDFAGNLHFNTLGNILATARAGLLFLDPDTGDLLHLTGAARVLLDAPEIAAFQGAERLWTVTPRRILRRRGALPLRFAGGEASPNSLMTGSWTEAEARLAAEADRRRWRPVAVAQVTDESATIRSLTLAPADGVALPGWKPGQHLPLRIPTADGPLVRTYTLTSAPSDGVWRISVKRDGRASQALHALRPGDRLEARAPDGAFAFDPTLRRPAVLVGAGVGVTPMVAMLRTAVWEGLRSRRTRPIWLFHGARTAAERAFDAEIAGLAAQAGGAVRVVRALSRPDATPADDHEHAGHVDLALLKRTLPFDDYDFYLCGPIGLVQGLYDGLRDMRVPDDRIHAESFGPSALKRRTDAAVPPAAQVSTGPVAVTFAKSGLQASWTPDDGPLLALAERAGLSPDASCRGGACGTCRTRVVDGAVAYARAPAYPAQPGEALICSALPADGAVRLVLYL